MTEGNENAEQRNAAATRAERKAAERVDALNAFVKAANDAPSSTAPRHSKAAAASSAALPPASNLAETPKPTPKPTALVGLERNSEYLFYNGGPVLAISTSISLIMRSGRTGTDVVDLEILSRG